MKEQFLFIWKKGNINLLDLVKNGNVDKTYYLVTVVLTKKKLKRCYSGSKIPISTKKWYIFFIINVKSSNSLRK